MKFSSISLGLAAVCAMPLGAAHAQSTIPAPTQGPILDTPPKVNEPTAAAPAEPGSRLREAMTKMDTNGDGSITLAEWTGAGRRDRGFKTLDANSDGRLTRDEIQSGVARMRSARGRSR